MVEVGCAVEKLNVGEADAEQGGADAVAVAQRYAGGEQREGGE